MILIMPKSRLIMAVICIILFGTGIVNVLRPVISGPSNEAVTDNEVSPPTVTAAPRGAQFFEANIDEARRVAIACRDGIIRGDECATAETAIMTVESEGRFKRFRTEQR